MNHTPTILLASAMVACGQEYAFTNFAGLPGVPGITDGTGSAARFNQPLCVAVDIADNVYVADTFSHTIRKITPAGVVTTLAGSPGFPGSADESGEDAQFNTPFGLVVDSAGNVYVGDTLNHTIRKVTPAGGVTTIAGSNGMPGYVEGVGSEARFNRPHGVAVDGAGNLYVGDTENYAIRKVTPDGPDWVVTTLAGAGQAGSDDGNGSGAFFSKASGVAATGAGNVFVGDTDNNTVRMITPTGDVTTIAGSPGSPGDADGLGGDARFRSLRHVTLDGAGNLYIADRDNHTIRKMTPAGDVTTIGGLAGSFGSADGIGSAARFDKPYGVAVDSAGNVYVADYQNSRISKGTPLVVRITRIQFISGNVQIDFTSGPGDTAGMFTLQSSGTVNGTYGDVSATITQEGPAGSFRAVRAPSGDMQFYRIKK